MIYFSCKQCGKVFERPEEVAGTLVFCVCGAGNRVPWESTVPAPSAEPESETASEPPSSRAVPVGEERPWPPMRQRPPRRYVREPRQRDRASCFNHQDRPSQPICADCNEVFCASCVTALQGQTLCGPCKNFRIRSMQRSRQLSVPAMFSLLLGLMTAPFGLFCMGMSASMKSVAPGFVALALPVAAFMLGAKALRDLETNPRLSGLSLAISGLVCGLVTAFLTAVWAVLIQRQME